MLGGRGIAVLHRAYVVCVKENSAGIHISTNIPVYYELIIHCRLRYRDRYRYR